VVTVVMVVMRESADRLVAARKVRTANEMRRTVWLFYHMWSAAASAASVYAKLSAVCERTAFAGSSAAAARRIWATNFECIA